jgi:hypothetical protein
MTEAEWLAAIDPTLMLEFMRGKASDRKLRLFACAWGFDVWKRMLDERSRKAILTAELFADGLVDSISLRVAFDGATAATKALTWASQVAVTASYEGYDMDRAISQIEHELGGTKRVQSTCERLRCLFGNPFRPVAVEPPWLTSDVLALATGVYEEKAFDRMPILADALMDAGCDNEDILNHCRQLGEHVRGCWVVDLILGKS